MRYSIILALATTAIAAPVVESPLDRTSPNQHDLFKKLTTNSEELRDPAVNKAAFQALESCFDTAAFQIPSETDPLCSLKPLNKRQLPVRYCTTKAEDNNCLFGSATDPLKCYDFLHHCCIQSASYPGFNLALDPICTSDMSPKKLATLPISAQPAVAKRQEDSVCLAIKESCLKEGSTLDSCLLKASNCCATTQSAERVCAVETYISNNVISPALNYQPEVANPKVIKPTQQDYVCTAVVVECVFAGKNTDRECLDKTLECCLKSEVMVNLCNLQSRVQTEVVKEAILITANAIVNEASQSK